MVKKTQTTNEYYETYYDDLDFYPPSRYDDDEQYALIICLLLLKRLFESLSSMTPEQILDEINESMSSFKKEMQKTAIQEIDNAVQQYFTNKMQEYNIPEKYVKYDTSMHTIVKSSITAITNQLKDDITIKAQFNKDNLSNTVMDIIPNFKRAISRLTDTVGNNLIYSKEKTDRNIKKFVYGADKLYKWYCVNDSKTCDWCIAQSKRPPRLIDDWELDHPNGRCSIEPIDYTYSPEYYAILSEIDL